MSTPESIPDLIARLREPGAARCEATMAALIEHGASAVAPLLVALDGLGAADDTPATRQRAALLRLLGSLGEPQGVLGHLFTHLEGAADDAARWAVTELCARHPSALGMVLDFLPGAEDPRVDTLLWLVQKLDAFGRREVVATLARWLDDAPQGQALFYIETALEFAGDAAAPACEALLRAAEREAADNPWFAVDFLELAAPFAPRIVFARVEHLLANWSEDDDDDVLANVLAALPRDDADRLARCRDHVRALHETHHSTPCIVALGELGDADDLPALRQHLSTPSSGTVVAAIDALRKLGDDELPAHLRRIATSFVMPTALNVAEHVQDDPVLAQALLEAHYPDDDPWVRPVVALALGRPAAWIVDALSVERPETSDANGLTRRALRWLSTHEAPPVTAAARCRDWWMRARAQRNAAAATARQRHANAELVLTAGLAWLALMPGDDATLDEVVDDLVELLGRHRASLRSALGVHAHAGLLSLPSAVGRASDALEHTGRALTRRAARLTLDASDRLGRALHEPRGALQRLQRLFPTHLPHDGLRDTLDAIDTALRAMARPHWHALLPERLHRELTGDTPDSRDAARRELLRRGASDWIVASV